MARGNLIGDLKSITCSMSKNIEVVAIDMGMDENLMKAGAYYHDIGKLRRPQFFVENQGGGPNVHDSFLCVNRWLSSLFKAQIYLSRSLTFAIL